MICFPDELDFEALFCVEPTRLDKDCPFYYDESTFRFENRTESFFVKMTPSYGEFLLEVKSKTSNELLAYQSFKTVDKLEIVTDTADAAKILLTMEKDRDLYMTTVEITFKPRFYFIMKEHFVG